MQAVVLAAGKGTRMRSRYPKVLQKVLGQPLLSYVLKTLKRVGVSKPVVVAGAGADQVCSFLKSDQVVGQPSVVMQKQQKGTGHAVMMAKRKLAGQKDILIWPGDMPLIREETIREFVRMHKQADADVSVLSSFHQDPTGYGRIIRFGDEFSAIREELDANAEERKVQEVNTGIYLFKAKALWGALKKVKPGNKKKELYLTDTIEILNDEGFRLEAFPLADETEALGVNDRKHLADVIDVIRSREIEYHQEQGVTIVSPDQTFIEPGVKLGQDSVVYPWSYLETGVVIGKRCEVGPFAKVRTGTKVGDDSVLGSFVEVARSKVGNKVLAKHLSYLGDSIIGDGANIGAGTVTANFDGRKKSKTKIGKKVLVGSNTVFVAPVHVGDRAQTGAGSVLTRGTRVKNKEVIVGVPAKPVRKK